MKKMDEMADLSKENNEEGFLEGLFDAAALCLMKQKPDYWDKKKHKKEGTEEYIGGYSEEFEEAADLPTVHHIIRVWGGVDVNDPKLIAAATDLLDRSGTN